MDKYVYIMEMYGIIPLKSMDYASFNPCQNANKIQQESSYILAFNHATLRMVAPVK